MTNIELLRKKIDDSGYKLVFIAEKCGLTYQGFLKKLKGESDFKATEMAVMKDLLNLDSNGMGEIFFGSDVDKTSTN